MSDPTRLGAKISPEELQRIWTAGDNLQRRCAGAVVWRKNAEGEWRSQRSTCANPVLEWKRGSHVYRAALCAGCSGREQRERDEAQEAAATSVNGARLRPVPR